MITDRIKTMLDSCAGTAPLFPPTELYNEGWLLRLLLDWFSSNDLEGHPLYFPKNSKWFSEALLPTAFLPKSQKDTLGESWTHADAVIGHFSIGETGKADLSLSENATHFVVLEAKMFSKLSSGVTHARDYDQAARTVACMAQVLSRAEINPSKLSGFGFYVLAPQSQIEKGVFKRQLTQESIRSKVERRVAEYGGEKREWFDKWFLPTIEQVRIESISWEQVLEDMGEIDDGFGQEIREFYERCLMFNATESRKVVS